VVAYMPRFRLASRAKSLYIHYTSLLLAPIGSRRIGLWKGSLPASSLLAGLLWYRKTGFL
jgi:hypothetical protein